MKNTEKEIMDRFQKFDFDKGGQKQAAVFAKVAEKAKAPAKKTSYFRPGLAFAAVICMMFLAGTFVVKNFTPEYDGIKGTYSVEVGSPPAVAAPQQTQPAKPAVAMAEAEVVMDSGAEYLRQNAVQAVRHEKARDTFAAMSIQGGRGRAAMAKGMVASYSYMPMPSAPDYNAMVDESFAKYGENTFYSAAADPLSTFSSDVDTASYGIVKGAIQGGRAVNPDSVRIEEFLNYFDYDYPQPEGKDPVSINFEYTDSPWNKGLKLVKIGVKARDIEKKDLPPSNLVFLIDVSGSMEQANRLPLVKKALRLLINELRPEDKVSIVTYANGVNEVLSGVKGSNKEKIINAVENLRASGGTNGSAGLEKAYEAAKKNFIRKGNNRVILATDGDFNIGPTSTSALEKQITEAKDSGVFLSVLGFGMGNYKDDKVQTLANKGNGNYAYIDDLFEARKVLVKEFGATLFTVAKDVKIQVEFNPAHVGAYRLIGYEKRKLANQDFNDDTKDAGEMGAGHTVTALYEIIPAGVKSEYMPDVDNLKYASKAKDETSGELLTVKLRYKEPSSDSSKLMEKALWQNTYKPFASSSDDMRFAAAVAQFGQILKDSPYKGKMTLEDVINTAKKAKGADDEGYRADFIKLLGLTELNK